jgi:hypothetical protein
MASEDGSVVSGLGPSGTGDGFLRKGSGDGSAIVTGAPIGAGGGPTYRMRGYDTTEARYVYWSSSTIDSGAANYGGPGPVLDIVVQAVLGE